MLVLSRHREDWYSFAESPSLPKVALVLADLQLCSLDLADKLRQEASS